MADLTWPSGLVPNSQDQPFKLTTNSQVVRPVLGGADRTRELQGSRWMVSMPFRSRGRDDQATLEALVMALDGPNGRILVPDHAYRGPRGGITGSPTITGNVRAKSVTIASMGGTGPQFKAGDRFSVNGELYAVIEDVTAVAGSATAQIRPPLRSTHAAAAIEYQAPLCRMRLVDDDQGVTSAAPSFGGAIMDFSLSFTEPLR